MEGGLLLDGFLLGGLPEDGFFDAVAAGEYASEYRLTSP